MSTNQLNETTRGRRGAGHVLIAGAGIGGLCLAQGLRKAGVSVAVYELPLERANELGLSALANGSITLVMPPRGGGMFVTQYARQTDTRANASDYSDLALPDLEDHVFWALIAQRSRFGAAGGELRRMSLPSFERARLASLGIGIQCFGS